MTDFTYTEAHYPNSRLVQAVWFNENENFVVLDLNDELYKYNSVARSGVDDLLNADSVGGYFNTQWVRTYGPGEHLGEYDDVFFIREDVKARPQVVNNFTTNVTNVKDVAERYGAGLVQNVWDEGPTREVSLQDVSPVAAQSVVNAPTDATKEVSLETPVTTVANYGISFNLDGASKYHVVKEDNLRDALDSFTDLAESLGIDADVTEVRRLG